MKRIENVLDKLGYSYDFKEENKGKWYGFIEFWTDTAGQDIPTEIYFDGTAEDFVAQFREAADNYDVDEEVDLSIYKRIYISQVFSFTSLPAFYLDAKGTRDEK